MSINVSVVLTTWISVQKGVHVYWICVGVRGMGSLASFPGLHAQLLSLAVRKAGGRPGRIYHVMRATTDVT